MSNYQQKLKQLDGRQQELVRDNYELKDLCLYLDEERNCIDLNCPHCGEKILSRPNSVVPPDEDEAVSQRLMDHKSKIIIKILFRSFYDRLPLNAEYTYIVTILSLQG